MKRTRIVEMVRKHNCECCCCHRRCALLQLVEGYWDSRYGKAVPIVFRKYKEIDGRCFALPRDILTPKTCIDQPASFGRL